MVLKWIAVWTGCMCIEVVEGNAYKRSRACWIWPRLPHYLWNRYGNIENNSVIDYWFVAKISFCNSLRKLTKFIIFLNIFGQNTQEIFFQCDTRLLRFRQDECRHISIHDACSYHLKYINFITLCSNCWKLTRIVWNEEEKKSDNWSRQIQHYQTRV